MPPGSSMESGQYKATMETAQRWLSRRAWRLGTRWPERRWREAAVLGGVRPPSSCDIRQGGWGQVRLDPPTLQPDPPVLGGGEAARGCTVGLRGRWQEGTSASNGKGGRPAGCAASGLDVRPAAEEAGAARGSAVGGLEAGAWRTVACATMARGCGR